MTIRELTFSPSYLKYRDDISVASMEILDMIVNENLLLTTPFRQVSATISVASLILMNLIAMKKDDTSLVDKGIYTAIDSICTWAGIGTPKEITEKAISDVISNILDTIPSAIDGSNTKNIESSLIQAALASAIGASYQVNKVGLERLTETSLGGLIEVVSGLNTTSLALLEEYIKNE